MSTTARVLRWVLGIIALIIIAIVVFAVATPTGRYLARAGWEEARILARRKPIKELVASPSTDSRTRAKLDLVLAARAFAVDSLRLRAKESFTTYSKVRSDTLVLVLSGAYRDRLEPYTWWFPIVGRVPYKGYFDPSDAHEAERALERRGLDTWLRPASAFSTLGWFNDPLLSTTLELDSVGLANTVIHELTHNTFYAPGQAVFNESFANFVGAHGATWFFRVHGDSALVRESEDDWAREKRYGRFLQAVYDALDSAYAAHPGSELARLAARDSVYAHAQVLFADSVAPYLPGYQPGMPIHLRLNNATLLARRVYRTGLDLFDDVLARENGDLRSAVAAIVRLAKERPGDPYAEIREWLGRRSGIVGSRRP